MYVSTWPGLNPRWLLQSPPPQPPPYPVSAPNRAFFYVARNAIYHLFRSLNLGENGTVLAPDYHSGNEVWAMRAAGATVRFYAIRRNLEPDFEELERLCRLHSPRVFYVIHYLGWPQPMREIEELCRRRNMLLVEDCALTMLSELAGRPVGSFGGYSVFCLYKTVPVPNGGMLVQNGGARADRPGIPDLAAPPLRSCSALSVAGRTAELALEWLRSRHPATGRTLAGLKQASGSALSRLRIPRVPVGDIGFDIQNVDLAMSHFCRKLIERFDYPTIRARRRTNYIDMQRRLDGRVTLLRPELEEGVCPLFFPILVSDKTGAARELQQRGIGAVEFWNYGDADAHSPGSDADYLRQHVLELPIHQDVTPEQVAYVADQVLRVVPPLKKASGRISAAGASLPAACVPAVAGETRSQ